MPMTRLVFKPKVPLWMWAIGIAILPLLVYFIITLSGTFVSVLVAVAWIIFFAATVTGVRYEVRGDRLGVRRFYHWTWIPVSEIKLIQHALIIGVQGPNSAMLSPRGLRVYLVQPNSTKSSMPVDISPADPEALIACLKQINPAIEVE